jgi:DNA-binding NarL/FixJ family response regulator
MTKQKILIADDHAMIREGIKILLKKKKEYEVIGEAVNGLDAVEKFKNLNPDLVILDISMPELSGMEAAKEILNIDPAALIIILSMYDDEDYIRLCLEIGVKSYVVKSESSEELVDAVKNVLAGESYYSSRVQQVIVKNYTSSAKKNKKEQLVKLTSRELEVVKLISEGLTSHEIAKKLFISSRTVETHRSNLLSKADAKNSMELLRKLSDLNIF